MKCYQLYYQASELQLRTPLSFLLGVKPEFEARFWSHSLKPELVAFQTPPNLWAHGIVDIAIVITGIKFQ